MQVRTRWGLGVSLPDPGQRRAIRCYILSDDIRYYPSRMRMIQTHPL